MMLALYPKIIKRTVALSLLLVGCIVALFLLRPSINPVVWIPLGLIGVAALVISGSNAAMQEHNRELQRLYEQLDAEGFVRDYSVHLTQKVPNQDTALMVRMHLSNAYAALGEFDRAISILADFPFKEGKNEEGNLLSRFAIASNLCYCAEQKGDLEEAERRLSELLALKERLTAMQADKAENKRMVFYTELNEQCLALMKNGKADIEVLRNQVQKNNRQMLPKITTSLWVARAYLADGQKGEAARLLRRIVELAPNLYPGKEAARLLSEEGMKA